MGKNRITSQNKRYTRLYYVENHTWYYGKLILKGQEKNFFHEFTALMMTVDDFFYKNFYLLSIKRKCGKRTEQIPPILFSIEKIS